MRLRPQFSSLIVPVSLIVVPVFCGCASPKYSMFLDASRARERAEADAPSDFVAGTDIGASSANGGARLGLTPAVPVVGDVPAHRKVEHVVSAQLAADKSVEQAVPAAQRMLIYSAQLAMAVADVEASVQATQRLADEVGGYMLTMSANAITIRVPAKQFFPVLERLKALGQTLSKNVNAQDVTDEYVDLQLRLKNAEALRDRFVAILEKAANVKDTLEIERELNRVREEIERIKGRIAQLDKLIAYSTIEVAFTQAQARPARVRRPQTPFPWLDQLGVETVLEIRD
jgi:hypothetical protein